MSDYPDFDRYLERRYQQAGALTPGQKLAVIENLRAEAHQGRFPFGNSVVSVPVDNPAVQAVLRGEEVSIGSASISDGSGGGIVQSIQNAPTWAKIALIVAIPLVMLLLSLGGGVVARFRATPTPTATLEPTPTQVTPPVDTPLPPPPTETPTATPVVSLMSGGAPGDGVRDPASIEIAGLLFILTKGKVSENGEWKPSGPEWLEGTEVRRVFSIPYDLLASAEISPGDEISVRTRGGQVLVYLVRDVIHLPPNKIEVFNSLHPSIVIDLPMQPGSVDAAERVVVFGDAKIDSGSSSESQQQGQTFIVSTPLNLRNNPGLHSQVLISLPTGTVIQASLSQMPVNVDGQVWIFVSTPYGYGWVAQNMLLVAP